MNKFVQSTSQYFRAFLETDFRKRRLPKRSLKSSDRSGNKITLNLDKYPEFKKMLIKSLQDSSCYDFEIPIEERQFTTKLHEDTASFLIKKIINLKDENVKKISSQLVEKLPPLIIELEKDITLLHERFLELLVEDIHDNLLEPALSNIEGTIERNRGSQYSNYSDMVSDLSELIIYRNDEFLKSELDLYVQNPDENPIDNIVEKILSDNEIESILKSYFENYNLMDFFHELASLSRIKKTKDNLEVYLNISLAEVNNSFFPIIFIPVDIIDNYENKKRILKICFEKKYFVNKHALEYCFQIVHNDKNVAALSSEINRVVNIEEDESVLTSIKYIMKKICPLFNIDSSFSDSLDVKSKASSGVLTIHSNFNLNIFDKGDESAINDYEELIDFLEGDEGIADEFSSLVDHFIREDPVNINTAVDKHWNEQNISEKLVFPSPIPLNEEQRKILVASKSKTGKYISVQGPPGTGKSHTISAILFDAIRDSRSVLMLSDKKEALDVVEDKLTEVLNIVRPDKNFQNPILRIGKSGNTYAKILSPQSTEQIKTAFEATREILNDKKNNLSDEVRDLKKEISENCKTYKDIDYREIIRYSILDNDSNLSKLISEDNQKYSEEIILEIDALSKVKNAFDELSDSTKSFLSHCEAQYTDQINPNLNSINAILFTESLAFSLETAKNKNLTSFFTKITRADINFISESLDFFYQTKNSFFKKIFLSWYLKDWNIKLNKTLSIIKDIDFVNNHSLLEDVLDFFSKLEQKSDSNGLDKNREEKLLSEVFSNQDHSDLADDKDKLIKFYENINNYKSIVSKNSFIIKNHVLEEYFDFLSDRYLRHIGDFGKLKEYLSLKDKLSGKFKSLKNIRYTDKMKDIHQDAALEMTQAFDSRFLEFAYNHSSTAKTFKNIITKKLRFPKDEFGKLKNAFPCIISGIRDYADYIPLQRDLFDLLIIDEASQVSIAQAFPAVLRAKKVIILGDNRQFSNVKAATASSDQNNTWLQTLKKEFNDSYDMKNVLQHQRAGVFNVRNSILEFFDYFSNYKCTLKKHFRCYPEIISFSSQYFYDGALQAIKIRAKPIEEVIEFDQINHDGLLDMDGNLNKIEANHIIKKLEEISERDDKTTLGVITPFRDQQRYILSLVDKSLSREKLYKNNKIKVMTFDSCQGEERDYIFYSMVEHENTKVSISTVLGKAFDMSYMDPENNLRLQRLNVGMSRAKEKVTFVLSKDVSKFSGNALLILNHYKQQIENSKKIPNLDKLESPMEKKVLSWIQQTRFYNQFKDHIELIPQFDVGKYLKMLNTMYEHPRYRCDFMMTLNYEGQTKRLIIEYDGFEHHFKTDNDINKFNYNSYYTDKDIERERILESYGFPFLRLNKFNITKEPVEYISNELNSFFLPSH